MDNLKFNVDGSARGNPGPAGIRGVLRDSKGKLWFVLVSLFCLGILLPGVALFSFWVFGFVVGAFASLLRYGSAMGCQVV